MNVLILSSGNKDINPYYLSIAKSISSFLAQNECDLVFGGCSTSMMGICYNEFVKNNRNIYSFTTNKYIDDLNNLNDSKKFIRENTFDMKKDMFNNSDLIVCLPGGIGTLSELLTYIEEKRSNDKNVPIIIYDENHFYDKLFEVIEKLEEEKFIDKSFESNYDVATNKAEFENLFFESLYNRKVK